MATACFWLSLLILAYCYLGYPLLIWILSRSQGRRQTAHSLWEPTVDILLAVHNEEKNIEARIRNFLALDYPSEKVRLFVGADGCEDRTVDLIRKMQQPRVVVVEQWTRRGKTHMLNVLAAKSQAELLAFTDADSCYTTNALRHLVAPFSDSRVGLVTGQTRYLSSDGRREELRGLYVRYEGCLKEAEARLAGVVGADGAIYALRRELWSSLPEAYINDFYHPVHVAKEGYRATFEPRAISEDKVMVRPRDEFGRQTRMAAQQLLIYLREAPRLLLRGRLLYLLQMTSHKPLRWLTLPLIGLLAIASVLLAPTNVLARLVLSAVFVFVLLALAGLVLPRFTRNRLVRVASYFLAVNAAFIVGIWRFVRGESFVTWKPRGN